MSAQYDKPSSATWPLWVLLFGNFIIGTGVLLPAGILNEISADLDVTSATAGLLMLTGGLVVGIGAPVLAALTSAIDRRTLLTAAILIYAIGHILSALVPSFEPLVALRALTIIGAAVFTPQAAATAGLLVPTEKRAATIAFIFIGWSAASVAGIPLGSYLASLVGWRIVYGGMGVVCLMMAALVWTFIRPGLFVQPLSASAWKQALTTPVIAMVLLVTLLSMSGQMMVFSYIAPILRDAFAGGAREVSIAFAVAGVFGVIGNTLASRIVGRFGIDRVIAIGVTGLIIGLGLFAAGFGSFAAGLAGIAIWGLGSFSSNSLQQSRLVALAPPLASATVALNTSAVYLGQAIGAGIGGWFIDHGVNASIAWTACAFTAAALAASLVASRMKGN
jgi:MFS transporter, DHA1 family, inner membrane transport protein